MQPVTEQERWLDSAEWARRFGVCVETVRRKCASDDIDAVKVGSVWRISPHAHEKLTP